MRRDDYWELFWLSGMPEAWMLSRPTESYPFSGGLSPKELPPRSGLPEEMWKLRQDRAEVTKNLTAE